MALPARSVSWEVPDDQIVSAVWLGIIWLGIVVGVGSDIPAFIALGLKYRSHPAVHKRLIMLAMVSVAADPGFVRSAECLSPPPTTPLSFLVSIFWTNVLLVVAMFGWDLWRRGRVHLALLIGGVSLLGAEEAAAFVFVNPTWNALASRIVHAWGYTGGMPRDDP